MANSPNIVRKGNSLETVEHQDSYQRSGSCFTECSDTDFEELEIPDTADLNLDEGDDDGGLPIIPFNSVYKSDSEASFTRRYFIPKTKITVKITDYERKIHKLLSPYVYIIELTHGAHKWTVKRRHKHFDELHGHLMVFKAKLKIPLPNKEHQERRKKKRFLPRFPKTPDAFISEDRLNRRMKILEKYLQNVLNSSVYRNHPETLAFLNVSRLSFVYNLGRKLKEGSVLKRAGGRRAGTGCFGLSSKLETGRWARRWLVLKDTFVAYISNSGRLGDVMLIDDEFDVGYGLLDTSIHHGLIVSNLTRRLMLKCKTHNKAKDWHDAVSDVIKTTADDFTTPNRFASYAPVREDSFANWFVDGDSYFYAVSLALENAKEEIFITDWWLSPEILLRRTIDEGPKWQLVNILRKKASQGVKIYVLLYKEVELALGINSLYSKQVLVKEVGDNIKILRHPDHVPGGVLLWAHHEKIVVVDQRIAFVGGLDLCYGRWDDVNHRLTDVGSVYLSCSEEPETPMVSPPTLIWEIPNSEKVCPINNNNNDMCPIDLVLQETVFQGNDDDDVFDETDNCDKDIPFIDDDDDGTHKVPCTEEKEAESDNHPKKSPKKPVVMVPVCKTSKLQKLPPKREFSGLSAISERSETGSEGTNSAEDHVSKTEENVDAVSDQKCKQNGKENLFFPSRSTNATSFSDVVQCLVAQKKVTGPKETKNPVIVNAVIEPEQGRFTPVSDSRLSNNNKRHDSITSEECPDPLAQDEIDKNQNIFISRDDHEEECNGKYKVYKVELDDVNQPESNSCMPQKDDSNTSPGTVEHGNQDQVNEEGKAKRNDGDNAKLTNLLAPSDTPKSIRKGKGGSPSASPKSNRKKKGEVSFVDNFEQKKKSLTPRASPALLRRKKKKTKGNKEDGEDLIEKISDASSFDLSEESKARDKDGKYKKKTKKNKYKKKDEKRNKSLEGLDEADGLLCSKYEDGGMNTPEITPELKRKSKNRWRRSRDSDSHSSDGSDSGDPTSTWPRAKLALKKAVHRMKSHLGSSSSEDSTDEDGEAENDKYYKTWTATKMATMSKAMNNFKSGLKSKKPEGLKLKIEKPAAMPTLVVSPPSPRAVDSNPDWEHSDDEKGEGNMKHSSKPLEKFRKAGRLASRLASMHSVNRQKSVDMTVEEEDILIYKRNKFEEHKVVSYLLGVKKQMVALCCKKQCNR